MSRGRKFKVLLSQPSVDLSALRDLLWSGAPEDDPRVRAEAWQMLLGHLPSVVERQAQGVARKRAEYEDLVREHFRFGGHDGGAAPGGDSCATAGGAAADFEATACLRQIRVDIPRTSHGGLAFLGHPRVQRLMERVLYIWSVRHPASGYVQGINDLVTPFVVVLLSGELRVRAEDLTLDGVDDATLGAVEAGAYWCLTKVLSDIQDHYTSGQPGIQSMVGRLRDIVRRIDRSLFWHLEEQGLDFLSFSFRWMNCLLLREFPLSCVIRLWDAYIAEAPEESCGLPVRLQGFSTFHVYVCAVFMIYWSPQLKQMDFQQLMLFMQKLPTGRWRTREIDTLLAEAFVLKSLFHASPKHLEAPPTSAQGI